MVKSITMCHQATFLTAKVSSLQPVLTFNVMSVPRTHPFFYPKR